MEQLRRRRKAGWEISQETGIPLSTVSKHLKESGLGRIDMARIVSVGQDRDTGRPSSGYVMPTRSSSRCACRLGSSGHWGVASWD